MASLSKSNVVGLVTDLGNALHAAGQSVRHHPYIAPPRAVKADVEAVMTERVEDAVNGIGSLHTALVNTSTDLATRTTERDNAITERDTARTERDARTTERDNAITDRDTARTERDNAITERDDAQNEVTRLTPYEAEVARLNPLLTAQDAEVRRLTPLYNTASGEVTRLNGEVASLTTNLGTANSRVSRVVKERNFGIGGGIAVAATIVLLWLVFGGSSDPALIAARDAAVAANSATQAQLATVQQDLANLRATTAATSAATPAATPASTSAASSVLPKNVATKAHLAKVVAQQKITDARQDGQILNLQQQVGVVEGKVRTLEYAMDQVRRTETNIANLEGRMHSLEGAARSSAQNLIVDMRTDVKQYHSAIQRVIPSYQPIYWQRYCN